MLWLSDCFLECKINNLVQLLYSYSERICSFVSVDELAGCAALSYTVTGLSEIMHCGTWTIKKAMFCMSLP
jgi:hypothetical protein